MKALVGAFNQEKALVGAFSVIVQLQRLIDLRHYKYCLGDGVRAPVHAAGAGLPLGAGPVLHPHQQAAVRRDVGAVQGQGHLQVTLIHTSLIPD